MANIPPSEQHAHWLFSGEAEFTIGATKLEHIPHTDLPEIAFTGRSNVGKSSLINALTGRKKLARTSVTPGHTRQLNFFLIRKLFMLVDMPGYGYAKASKSLVKGWNRLSIDYLKSRRNLQRVFLLIDGRRGVKDSDEDIMHILDEAAVTYQIVLTKCDKTKKSDVDAILSDIDKKRKNHPALFDIVSQTSSVKQTGITELKNDVVSLLTTNH